MIHGNCLAHTFRRSLFVGGLVMLSACAGYSVNINENPIYNPPTLFSDYRIGDHALSDCVQQTIEDQRVTAAEQLTQLNCSSAGIERLDGLETFIGLRAVSLADNKVEDIDILRQLTRLELLILRNNQIDSAEPLLPLLRLEELDLRGNEALACTDAKQLAENIDGRVRLPTHC